jgi:small subunit ribosomal protein S15e
VCHTDSPSMATAVDKEKYEKLKKQRTFYKFTYRGLELEQLLELNDAKFAEMVHARARRRMMRGMKKKSKALMKKLRKAKKDVKVGEKPATVKTHLRDCLIVPEMIGSVVGIYNGKQFNAVELKGEMIGHYLAEFSLSYKPVRHGRPGIGATHSSRFIPLK